MQSHVEKTTVKKELARTNDAVALRRERRRRQRQRLRVRVRLRLRHGRRGAVWHGWEPRAVFLRHVDEHLHGEGRAKAAAGAVQQQLQRPERRGRVPKKRTRSRR
jgi:hypothetical protein